MKLLQNSKLESISASLCVNTGDCVLNGRSVSVKFTQYVFSLVVPL